MTSVSTASGHATSSQADGLIRPAGLVAALVVLLTLLAMAAVLSTGWNVWLKTLLAIAALTYAGFEVMRLLRPPWHSIKLADRELIVQSRHGQAFRIELRSSPFLSPLFIGFHARIKGSRRPVRLGLFRGQLDDQDFRRLSVGLRDLSNP